MTRHPIEATASELTLLAQELQHLTGAPDVLDRANDLLWQTASRLSQETRPRHSDSAILAFPAPKLILTLPAGVPS